MCESWTVADSLPRCSALVAVVATLPVYYVSGSISSFPPLLTLVFLFMDYLKAPSSSPSSSSLPMLVVRVGALPLHSQERRKRRVVGRFWGREGGGEGKFRRMEHIGNPMFGSRRRRSRKELSTSFFPPPSSVRHISPFCSLKPSFFSF